MTLGVVAVMVAALVLIVGLAGGSQSSRRPRGPFAWLHPAAPPRGWHATRIADGATLPYPPTWKTIKTDPKTASVALLGRGHRIDAFLNATPKQGAETLADWTRFRTAHNRGEGNRNIHLIASATGLTFRSGRGSCVIDDYTTSIERYRELACLVSGRTATAVVVAGAPTALWPAKAATLERAVSSFTP